LTSVILGYLLCLYSLVPERVSPLTSRRFAGSLSEHGDLHKNKGAGSWIARNMSSGYSFQIQDEYLPEYLGFCKLSDFSCCPVHLCLGIARCICQSLQVSHRFHYSFSPLYIYQRRQNALYKEERQPTVENEEFIK